MKTISTLLTLLFFLFTGGNLYSQCQVIIMPDATEVCAGNMVMLKAQFNAADSACMSTFSYLWSTGSTDSIITPMPTMAASTYSVTMTDTNDSLNMSSATIMITVNPLPSAIITGPPRVCVDGQITLNGNPSGGTGDYSHTWVSQTPSIATVVGTNSTAEVNGESIGSVNIFYTAMDTKGCSTTVRRTLGVVDIVASISGPSSSCAGDTVILNCSSMGAESYSWSSSMPGVATILSGATSSSISLRAISNGTTMITCTTTSADGCSDEATWTFSVFDVPSPTITGLNSGCETESTTLSTENISGITGHSWSSSDTDVATITPGGPTAIVNFISEGTAIITYTGTNGSNCSGSDTYLITVFEKPSASISGAPNICEGNSVNLTCTASGGESPYTYTWSSSNTNAVLVSPGSNGMATLSSGPNAGSANITCVVSDMNGCTALATHSFEYFDNPVASITGNTEDCVDRTLLLNGNPTGGTPPFTNVWTSDDPNIATVNSTIPAAQVSLENPGTTTIRYTVTDLNGCSASTSIQVTAFEEPSAGITGTLEDCVGGSQNLNGNPSGGSGFYTHDWQSSNASVASVTPAGATATVDALSPGITTITYTLTDDEGCGKVVSQMFTVFENPVADAGIDYIICESGEVTLGGSPTAQNGTTPYTYSWTSGAAAVANPSVSPSSDANYSLTVTDDNGCSDTDMAQVTVFPDPKVNISGTSAVCSGDFGQLVAVTSDGPGTAVYIWEENIGSGWVPAAGTLNGNLLDIDEINTTTDYRVRLRFEDGSGTLVEGCEAILSEVHRISVVMTPDPMIESTNTTHCQNGLSLFYNANARIGSEHTWSIFGTSTVLDTILGDGLLLVRWPNEANVSFTVRVLEEVGSDCKDSTDVQITTSGSTAPDPADIFLSPINNTLIYNDSGLCYQWGFFDPKADIEQGEIPFGEFVGETFQSFIAGNTYDEELVYWCQAFDCNSPECSTTTIYRAGQGGTLEEEPTPARFLLYPNPNDGNFNFEMSYLLPNTDYEIRIINALGQLIQRKQVQTVGDLLRTEIQVHGQSSGVYYLGLYHRGELQKIEAFVVQP